MHPVRRWCVYMPPPLSLCGTRRPVSPHLCDTGWILYHHFVHKVFSSTNVTFRLALSKSWLMGRGELWCWRLPGNRRAHSLLAVAVSLVVRVHRS